MDGTTAPQPEQRKRRHRFYPQQQVQTRCTKDTPRCADARNYLVALRDCCRGHIVEIMREMHALLAEAGVRWWLDYGSLLGAMRNPLLGLKPGIIPHDKDGDCGVLGEDFDAFMSVRPRVEALGMQWRYSPVHAGNNQYRGGNRVKVRISEANHTNIDWFFWYRVTPENRDSFPWVTKPNDGMRHRMGYIGVDRYKGREFPEEKLLPLTTLEWEGMQLPAPADPLWFVEHRYGPNWRAPVAANNDGIRR